jgi:hypothetical protein
MTIDGANAAGLIAGISLAHEKIVAVFLALLAAGAAYALAPFANEKPAVAAVAAIFPILVIALLGLPALQCLRLGPRILLILLALRPLVDVSSTFQPGSTAFALKSSSGFSLQEGFGAVLGIFLVAVWVAEGTSSEYTKVPNLFLTVLLGLTSFSWFIGGLGEGARGFARTAWGLLVGLLLGSFFRSEKQIDLFVRAVFYSSFLFLITLGLNLGKGMSGTEVDPLWRLSGQYFSPNSLAGVTFSFFLCGLYVLARTHRTHAKLLSLLLLSLLAVVIVSTQSRTVGALMLISVCVYLWTSRRHWLLYGVTVPLLMLLLASTVGAGWRLVSSFLLTNEQVNPNVLTLQGRIFLWGEWLTNFRNASLNHKVFGLGWGVMLRNFLSMAFTTSSVTENSFLWFLMGAGALALLAFIAYLFWVLFRAGGAWRRASSDFQRQFALLAFLTTFSFVIEAFTTDVVSAPNADVYLFGIMSIFVFQWLRNAGWRPSKVANNRILRELQGAC